MKKKIQISKWTKYQSTIAYKAAAHSRYILVCTPLQNYETVTVHQCFSPYGNLRPAIILDQYWTSSKRTVWRSLYISKCSVIRVTLLW